MWCWFLVCLLDIFCGVLLLGVVIVWFWRMMCFSGFCVNFMLFIIMLVIVSYGCKGCRYWMSWRGWCSVFVLICWGVC